MDQAGPQVERNSTFRLEVAFSLHSLVSGSQEGNPMQMYVRAVGAGKKIRVSDRIAGADKPATAPKCRRSDVS